MRVGARARARSCARACARAQSAARHAPLLVGHLELALVELLALLALALLLLAPPLSLLLDEQPAQRVLLLELLAQRLLLRHDGAVLRVARRALLGLGGLDRLLALALVGEVVGDAALLLALGLAAGLDGALALRLELLDDARRLCRRLGLGHRLHLVLGRQLGQDGLHHVALARRLLLGLEEDLEVLLLELRLDGALARLGLGARLVRAPLLRARALRLRGHERLEGALLGLALHRREHDLLLHLLAALHVDVGLLELALQLAQRRVLGADALDLAAPALVLALGALHLERKRLLLLALALAAPRLERRRARHRLERLLLRDLLALEAHAPDLVAVLPAGRAKRGSESASKSKEGCSGASVAAAASASAAVERGCAQPGARARTRAQRYALGVGVAHRLRRRQRLLQHLHARLVAALLVDGALPERLQRHARDARRHLGRPERAGGPEAGASAERTAASGGPRGFTMSRTAMQRSLLIFHRDEACSPTPSAPIAESLQNPAVALPPGAAVRTRVVRT